MFQCKKKTFFRKIKSIFDTFSIIQFKTYQDFLYMLDKSIKICSTTKVLLIFRFSEDIFLNLHLDLKILSKFKTSGRCFLIFCPSQNVLKSSIMFRELSHFCLMAGLAPKGTIAAKILAALNIFPVSSLSTHLL